MPVLCFVIDTSASMNQKTSSGQRIIDIAKKSVDNFVSKVYISFFLVPRFTLNNLNCGISRSSAMGALGRILPRIGQNLMSVVTWREK